MVRMKIAYQAWLGKERPKDVVMKAILKAIVDQQEEIEAHLAGLKVT